MGQVERRFEMRQLKRQDLLDAAQKLIFEQGFNKTNIDEIAKEAEFSKKTLYTYFNSKNEIYYLIMLRGYQKLLKAIQSQYQRDFSNNLYNHFESFWKIIKQCSQYDRGYLEAIHYFWQYNEKDQVDYQTGEYNQLKEELLDYIMEFFNDTDKNNKVKSELTWGFILSALTNKTQDEMVLQSCYELLCSMVEKKSV